MCEAFQVCRPYLPTWAADWMERRKSFTTRRSERAPGRAIARSTVSLRRLHRSGSTLIPVISVWAPTRYPC